MLLISLVGSVVFYALYGYAVTLPDSSASARVLTHAACRGLVRASPVRVSAPRRRSSPIARRRSNERREWRLIGIAFGAGFTPRAAHRRSSDWRSSPANRGEMGALASIFSLVALLIAIAILQKRGTRNHKADKEFFSIARTIEVLKMPSVGVLDPHLLPRNLRVRQL